MQFGPLRASLLLAVYMAMTASAESTEGPLGITKIDELAADPVKVGLPLSLPSLPGKKRLTASLDNLDMLHASSVGDLVGGATAAKRETDSNVSVAGMKLPTSMLDKLSGGLGGLTKRETGADLSLDGKPAPEFLVETLTGLAKASKRSPQGMQLKDLSSVPQAASGAADLVAPIAMAPLEGYVNEAKFGFDAVKGVSDQLGLEKSAEEALQQAMPKRDSLDLGSTEPPNFDDLSKVAMGAGKQVLPIAMSPVNGYINTAKTGIQTVTSASNFLGVPKMIQQAGVGKMVNKAAAGLKPKAARGLADGLTSFAPEGASGLLDGTTLPTLPGLESLPVKRDPLSLPNLDSITGALPLGSLPVKRDPLSLPNLDSITGALPLGSLPVKRDPLSLPNLDSITGALPLGSLPVKRQAEEVFSTGDAVRDAALKGKDVVNAGSGTFVKTIFGERDAIIPPMSLFPGSGPQTKKFVKDAIGFLGVPIPGVTKRMEKVKRKN